VPLGATPTPMAPHPGMTLSVIWDWQYLGCSPSGMLEEGQAALTAAQHSARHGVLHNGVPASALLHVAQAMQGGDIEARQAAHHAVASTGLSKALLGLKGVNASIFSGTCLHSKVSKSIADLVTGHRSAQPSAHRKLGSGIALGDWSATALHAIVGLITAGADAQWPPASGAAEPADEPGPAAWGPLTAGSAQAAVSESISRRKTCSKAILEAAQAEVVLDAMAPASNVTSMAGYSCSQCNGELIIAYMACMACIAYSAGQPTNTCLRCFNRQHWSCSVHTSGSAALVQPTVRYRNAHPSNGLAASLLKLARHQQGLPNTSHTNYLQGSWSTVPPFQDSHDLQVAAKLETIEQMLRQLPRPIAQVEWATFHHFLQDSMRAQLLTTIGEATCLRLSANACPAIDRQFTLAAQRSLYTLLREWAPRAQVDTAVHLDKWADKLAGAVARALTASVGGRKRSSTCLSASDSDE